MKKGNHKGHEGGTKNTKAFFGALRAPIMLFVPLVSFFVPFVVMLFFLFPLRWREGQTEDHKAHEGGTKNTKGALRAPFTFFVTLCGRPLLGKRDAR